MSCPLLQAVAQLYDAWWAECMLPRLLTAGSAGNVALTCKQLRDVSQRSRTCLTVQGSQLQQLQGLACIPARFPSCKQLTFKLDATEQACFHLPAALDVLVGLPLLTLLQLDLTNSVANNPSAVAAALGALVPWQLRQQQLQQAPYTFGLKLALEGCWQGHKEVWQALARLTQLSSLQLCTGKDEPSGLKLGHLTALAPLGSCLQFLEVDVGELQGPEQSCDFVSRLTCLTALELPIAGGQGMGSIALCSDLQNLVLDAGYQPSTIALGPADCAALAQLVQLRRLELCSCEASDPNAVFLSGLRQLEWLSLDGLSPAAMPALAELTRLTDLTGDWDEQRCDEAARQASSTAAAARCRSVRCLDADGPVRFEFFPEVETVVQRDSWQPAAFSSLARHCKQLKRVIMPADTTSLTFDAAAPTAACVQALHALADLQQLTHLSLCPRTYAEIAALANCPQLRSLSVVLADESSCTPLDLAQLAALRQLQQLSIKYPAGWLVEHGTDMESVARQLLLSVRHVEHVQIVGQPQDEQLFLAAQAATAADGLSGLVDLDFKACWFVVPEQYHSPTWAWGQGWRLASFYWSH